MPAAQGKHEDWPVEGLYVPEAQDKHALIDAFPVDGLKVPAAQGKHEDWPVEGLYVPAAQGKHALIDVLPVYGLYVPAGHGFKKYRGSALVQKCPVEQRRH